MALSVRNRSTLEGNRWEGSQCACHGSVFVFYRYMTDHVESLSMGVLSRLVRGNDTLMALVPLLSKAPWQRRHATPLPPP